MTTCPVCGTMSDGALCKRCGTDLYDPSVRELMTASPGRSAPQQADLAESIVLTTAPWLEGYSITKTIDIVTAECVLGMNIFKDMVASLRDAFGGRSQSTQRVLRDARKECLSELRREASQLGANAVIAVDLDYAQDPDRG